MLAPATENGDGRRRLWAACASPLFDFWLDDDTLEEDFLAVGRVARHAGFSGKQVRTIYWREVVPAVLGSWGLMDPTSPLWLEQRITKRPRLGYCLTWLFRPWWGWVAWSCWRQIARGMRP
jgi:hypothetical protein